MKEEKINILSDEVLGKADGLCFTSNGVVKKDLRLVMGAGVAKAFRDKFTDLDLHAGLKVDSRGNKCQVVRLQSQNDNKPMLAMIAFPTKEHWKNNSSIELIITSAYQLMKIVDSMGLKNVYITRPGCGLGGLKWKDVKPILERIFDDRITVCLYLMGQINEY